MRGESEIATAIGDYTGLTQTAWQFLIDECICRREREREAQIA